MTERRLTREAFETLTEAALIDLGAQLSELKGSAAGAALMTLLARLEADVALQALEGEPEDLRRYQGQREALEALRYQLGALVEAAAGLAREAVAQGRLQAGELGRFPEALVEDDGDLPRDLVDFTRPGGADFGG